MRYTLKDYQDDAVADVLAHLARARDSWHQWKSPVAFSLTATTGAGKTVMAAAVIEALFDGNSDHDFDSDPGAVVLWFTRRPVAQRADPVPSAGCRRPDRPLAPSGDREHLQPGETRTGQGLLPQCPEAGEEVAPGQGSPREFAGEGPA